MRKALLVAAIVAGLATPALAQFKTHKDGGGYTYRSPSSTYSYRYDTGSTYQRYGNGSWYSDRSGTSGSSYYGRGYRHDSFSNSSRGWSGSGSTFYKSPSYSTYRRSYNRY